MAPTRPDAVDTVHCPASPAPKPNPNSGLAHAGQAPAWTAGTADENHHRERGGYLCGLRANQPTAETLSQIWIGILAGIRDYHKSKTKKNLLSGMLTMAGAYRAIHCPG